MEAPALVSVGYEGRSVEELLDALKSRSVKVLVDVRLTPLSRKPGLSKRRLAAALQEADISYLHLPALGNPKDNRELFRTGDPASHARFRAVLRGGVAVEALDRIVELLGTDVVAVLCFERSHDQCHRHLVTEAVLASEPQVELIAI